MVTADVLTSCALARRQATDLSVAQAVEAEREDLAGDRDLGDLASASLGDPLVGVAQRAAAPGRVLCGLDERPAQRRRALGGDVAEPVRLPSELRTVGVNPAQAQRWRAV